MDENMEFISGVFMPQSAREAFDAANEKHGGVFIPCAFLASQVVAGLNFAYLCGAKNDGERLYTVKIYRNLRGDARITSVSPVAFSEKAVISEKKDGRLLCGGWNVNTEQNVSLSSEDRSVFDGAIEKNGVGFNPLSVILKSNESKVFLSERGGALYLIKLQAGKNGDFQRCSYARLVPFS